MSEQPPQWPGNEEQEAAPEYNPFWQPASQRSYKPQFEYAGPRPWYEVFGDFLTMKSEDDCAYLINEPTANFGHAYRWYAAVNGVIIILSVVLMLIFLPMLPDDAFQNNQQTSPGFNNRNTTRQVETFEFAPENLINFYCVFGPISIVANIIIQTLILLVVHTAATSAFQGSGEFEKVVYGIFTLGSAFSVAYFIAAIVLAPLFIVLFLMAEALFFVAYCFLFIGLLGVFFYVLYLYTLIVKTVYQIGWGGAFVSGIVVPFVSLIVLYCGLIFCVSTTNT